MKRIIILITIVVLGGSGIAYLASQNSSTSNEQNSSQKASAYDTIQKELDAGALLIDVRTQEEFDTGHIKNAVLFPLQDIDQGKLPTEDKTTKLYVYCRSGNRSAQATRIFEKAGYVVTDLGGMTDVLSMGATSTN
jgi:rhodanese-related sulfurtransferase